MQVLEQSLAQLSQLHRLQSPDDQRAAWRQGVAQLAAAAADHRAVPLEDADPAELRLSVAAALRAGLLDDLDWLSAPAAAAAIHELAAALPHGAERGALTRHALQRVEHGDGPTFVALATASALGTMEPIAPELLRSRVALSLALQSGVGTQVDSMALALISRQELQAEYLVRRARGSLPSRRLAARLLERAAREAARRAGLGDDSGLRVFSNDLVAAAFRRLLADRESLVWRHVATARGLLSVAIEELDAEIERNLDPELSPTEWRRAAASLAARIAVAPSRALARARALLSSGLFAKDRGLAGAMIFGLPRAAEIEPETAETLLQSLVEIGGSYAIDSLVELLRERSGNQFGERTAERVVRSLQTQLARSAAGGDLNERAAAALTCSQLQAARAGLVVFPNARFAQALEAFGERGADEAFALAVAGISDLAAAVVQLEASDDADAQDAQEALRTLTELDCCLLQSSQTFDLLSLGGARWAELAPRVQQLLSRLTDWLLAHEAAALNGELVEPALRMRRLVTLLHVMDAEPIDVRDPSCERARRAQVARCLLTQLPLAPAAGFRRVICATLARAFDAMVREDGVEISDVLLLVGSALDAPDDIATLAEGSMVPEIEAGLVALAQIMRLSAAQANDGVTRRQHLDALRALANALPAASSPRVAALRRALLELQRGLEALATLRALSELDANLLSSIESACQALAQLLSGASRRVFGHAQPSERSGRPLAELAIAIDELVSGARSTTLERTLRSATTALVVGLPRWLSHSLECVLGSLSRTPARVALGHGVGHSMPPAPRKRSLPQWVPPSRMLGNFHLVQPLGEGAGGSVFVVTRAEDRHKPSAERFALKVPSYDGQAARALSEQEFLKLFRDEAGALLALPEDHPNLARFVTFDAGVKPKPVLVMELVEGISLARVIERGALSVSEALRMLDGVAAGLEAMHALGIAHLDIKPLNIVLRNATDTLTFAPSAHQGGEPVLVDFGLSGRHLRPGCATTGYGAPEVWGYGAPSKSADPRPADVYAFACLVYETLTGRELFRAPSEVAMIAAHISHDGMPAPLAAWQEHQELAELAECLRGALRREAGDRSSISEVRACLAALRPALEDKGWPIELQAEARAA